MSATSPAPGIGAADLLRSVGLLADGPVTWGRPVPSGAPGVFVVEWAEPLAAAPIELTRVGGWLVRLPGLRLDGRRPTSRELAARLHDFWLPGQVVVYIGMTPGPIGARVRSLASTPLGERRPFAGGQWLMTLGGLEKARVWWAETTAVEEYGDALFGAFAGAVDASPEAAPRLPDRTLVLPFANLEDATGRRKAHGITGAVEPRPPTPAVSPPTIRTVPDAAADGAEATAAARPLERRRETHRPVQPAPSRTSLRGPQSLDVAAINATLQAIACRTLIRELTVADAASELVAAGFFRGVRGQPVAALRELLKQGLIEGAHQDLDRRWTIRCTRM